MKKIAILLMVVLTIVFADVGPAPPAPDVTVNLVYNNGSLYSDPVELEYHCNVSGLNISEQLVDNWGSVIGFACTGGVCKNMPWTIYKLSPCFYPKDGYFVYTIKGKNATSQNIGFQDGSTYMITLNSETGAVQGKKSQFPCAMGFVVLLAPLAGLLAVGRWN